LIVLDEPNSNLDDQGEAALADTIRRLKAKKRTVVIVTHRMTTLAVADSILVMHEGTVKAHGPRDQILAAMRSANAGMYRMRQRRRMRQMPQLHRRRA
jgi:ABC-type protease/lipase transport system fused ATPase/permease subunit